MPEPARTLLYLRPDEMGSAYNKAATTDLSRYRRFLAGACRFVDQYTGRRFDDYHYTRTYTNHTRDWGGLIDTDGYLCLDHDLRAVTALVDSNGASASEWWAIGDPIIRRVRPEPYGGWGNGTAISLAGRWGYGGYWDDLGTTLSAGLNASATTCTLTADGPQAEMLVQIDSEYLLITAYNTSTNTATVKRGFNGSTAATHSSGAALSYFVVDEVINDMVGRLVAWKIEQSASPLSGQVVIGDFSYPVNTDGLPKDVITELSKAGYIKVPRIKSV